MKTGGLPLFGEAAFHMSYCAFPKDCDCFSKPPGCIPEDFLLLGSALFQAVQGFFSDAWGRKPTAILMSAVSMISFLIFYIGANRFWNPYLVGFLAGARWGATGHPAILWA